MYDYRNNLKHGLWFACKKMKLMISFVFSLSSGGIEVNCSWNPKCRFLENTKGKMRINKQNKKVEMMIQRERRKGDIEGDWERRRNGLYKKLRVGWERFRCIYVLCRQEASISKERCLGQKDKNYTWKWKNKDPQETLRKGQERRDEGKMLKLGHK